ncbi:hypothetical protein ACI6Q2_01290 [Chitinophagaceae bacterium LWZ2-11]
MDQSERGMVIAGKIWIMTSFLFSVIVAVLIAFAGTPEYTILIISFGFIMIALFSFPAFVAVWTAICSIERLQVTQQVKFKRLLINCFVIAFLYGIVVIFISSSLEYGQLYLLGVISTFGSFLCSALAIYLVRKSLGPFFMNSHNQINSLDFN